MRESLSFNTAGAFSVLLLNVFHLLSLSFFLTHARTHTHTLTYIHACLAFFSSSQLVGCPLPTAAQHERSPADSASVDQSTPTNGEGDERGREGDVDGGKMEKMYRDTGWMVGGLIWDVGASNKITVSGLFNPNAGNDTISIHGLHIELITVDHQQEKWVFKSAYIFHVVLT